MSDTNIIYKIPEASGGSPLTTKGDLFTYSTEDARLGVGADGEALLSDSSEPTGLKWGTVSDTNMANADLTLDADRTHYLNGNTLTINGTFSGGQRTAFQVTDAGAVEVLNSTTNRGLLVQAGGVPNNNLRLYAVSNAEYIKSNNTLRILAQNVHTAMFSAKRMSLNSTTLPIPSTLYIKGEGSTSATSTLLVENSLGDDLFKIDDAGGFSLGNGATYTNNQNVSIGTLSVGTGQGATATGYLASANSTYSTAYGSSTDANQVGATAIGWNSTVTGQYGTAVGYSITVGGSGAALGKSINCGIGSVAIGNGPNVAVSNSVGIGTSVNVSGLYGSAIGYQSQSATYGAAYGIISNAGTWGTAIGPYTTTSASYSTAIGGRSTVTAGYSTMISASAGAKTNNVANSFAVNCNSTDHLFFVGNTADGWLNSTGGFVFGATSVDASAALQVESTTKGFLIPRMTTTEKNAISTPATSLMLFDSTLGEYQYYDGAAWTGLGGSADNMATADLTLTGDRAHDLDGNKLTLKTSSPTTGYLGIRNSETASGVECLKIWSEISPRYSYINNVQNSLFLGGSGDLDQLELANGFAKYKTRVIIIPSGAGGDAHLQVRGATGAVSSTKVFLVEDNGGAEAFRVTNDKQTYTKRLNVTGLGGTSATTAFLVENTSATEAFKILDNSAIIMANLPTSASGLATGQIWNNSGVLNIV